MKQWNRDCFICATVDSRLLQKMRSMKQWNRDCFICATVDSRLLQKMRSMKQWNRDCFVCATVGRLSKGLFAGQVALFGEIPKRCQTFPIPSDR